MDHISLVIPTHNRYRTLRITMPYYLRQKNVKEIIIVDDGSNDETESYISKLKEKDSRIVYIKHSKRMGPSCARNTGINRASNNYVLIGEDDVIFHYNYSRVLSRALRKLNADIVGGRLLFLKHNETLESCISRHHKQTLDGKIIKEPLFFGDFSAERTESVLFLHACVLFRKEVFDVVRYDENYLYNYFREETDIFLNAKEKGFKIFLIKDAVAFHLPTISRSRGGCRHFDSKSVVLKILAGPRKLAAYNLSSPLLRTIFHQLDIDDCIMKFINNNYFVEKYFSVLKKEFHLNNRKTYYKLFFAKHLLMEKLLFLQRLIRSCLCIN